MSISAHNRATASPALMLAWQCLYQGTRKRSRNTAGIDGVRIDDFAADGVANINKLARQLRSRTFAFGDLRPHFVPKPNGNLRLICVPTVTDRIVQRALLGHLCDSW